MNIDQVFEVLAKVGTFSSWVFAILGIFLYKKSNPLYKTLIIYFWIIALFEIISLIFMGNNLFIFPLSSLVDLVLFFYLYYNFFLKKGSYRYILMGFAVVGIVLVLIDLVKSLEPEFSSLLFWGSMFVSLLIIVFSIIYFLQIVIYSTLKVRSDYTLLNVLILLLFLINMLFMLTSNYLINENVEIVSYFWIIRIVINVVSNTIIFFLIWKHGRTPKALQ